MVLPPERLQVSTDVKQEFGLPEDIRAAIDGGENILIQGKAGTGKSTILRAIVKEFPGSVVLSPTGIAALNVGGQTIHSFFGLSFGYLQAPDVKPCTRQLEIIRSKPLLLIDEVSMVRADVLNAINTSLQKAMRSTLPFAGLQVILVGDTGQLPPVVVDAERSFFPNGSAVFFRSQAYMDGYFRRIELTKVHRQTELEFVDFLGRVRAGTVTYHDLIDFNAGVSICDAPRSPDSIVLCTTNRGADTINQDQYQALTTPETQYQARVTGMLTEREHPTQEFLRLKPDAKVLMLKNDSEGRWVNGTTANIARLERGRIWVRIEGREYEVTRETWEKYKYEPDPEGTGVKKVVAGTFEQFPVKLAWGITVHKSQGMTLSKFHFDLRSPPFEHGQLYVALSRARNREGLSLSRGLRASDIRVDTRMLLL